MKVRELTIQSVMELFQFRAMMESYALSYAFESKTKRILAGKLDMIVNEMEQSRHDPLEFIKFDIKYHTTIIENLSNSLLLKIWKDNCDENDESCNIFYG